jgi:hypothetical protein
MSQKNFHPSDEQLLQYADGELGRFHAARVQTHLAACWDCRARAAKLERAIVDFVEVHHQSFDPQLPPPAGARASLKAQAAEVAQNLPSKSWWNLRFSGLALRLACSAAVLLLIVGISAKVSRRHSMDPGGVATTGEGLLPDHSLTPGATRHVNLRDVCAEDHDDVVRAVPATLEAKVFQEYGLSHVREQNYEVDYLISPGLGGSDDIRNLWPEPRYSAAWNSFVKDQLEDYLHASVCNGRIGLDTAQKDVSADWISAYKKYFHTDQPRPSYSVQASDNKKLPDF